MNDIKSVPHSADCIIGADISLQQMLDARERRVVRQAALLKEHSDALICFTLNIPGPKKSFSLATQTFHSGCRRIEAKLQQNHILVLEQQIYEEPTGCEAYYCVNKDVETVKALMCSLEDQDPLGRIFDIDVLRQDGTKLSRTDLSLPGRTCLLCGQPAPICARSRAHSVDELIETIISIMTEYNQQ